LKSKGILTIPSIMTIFSVLLTRRARRTTSTTLLKSFQNIDLPTTKTLNRPTFQKNSPKRSLKNMSFYRESVEELLKIAKMIENPKILQKLPLKSSRQFLKNARKCPNTFLKIENRRSRIQSGDIQMLLREKRRDLERIRRYLKKTNRGALKI